MDCIDRTEIDSEATDNGSAVRTVVITPSSFLENELSSENKSYPKVMLTNVVHKPTDSSTEVGHAQISQNEHSYTKDSESNGHGELASPTPKEPSFVIVDGRVMMYYKNELTYAPDTTNKLQGQLSSPAAFIPTSPKKTIEVKEEPVSPTKVNPVPSVSSLQTPVRTRLKKTNPKKIVRLLNPSNGSHKTFFITAQGHSKKSNFVQSNVSSSSQLPTPPVATFSNPCGSAEATCIRDETSQITPKVENYICQENHQQSSTETEIMNYNHSQINARPSTEYHLQTKDAVPAPSPITIQPLDSHNELSQDEFGTTDQSETTTSQIQYKTHNTARANISTPQRVFSIVGANHLNVLGNMNTTQTSGALSQAESVTCQSLVETLINNAPTKLVPTPKQRLQALNCALQTLQTSQSASSGMNSHTYPPVLHEIVLTSSNATSTVPTQNTSSKTVSHVKLTSFKSPEAPTEAVAPSNCTGFDPGPKDDSLTNIQWLGKMTGQKLVNDKGVPIKQPLQNTTNSATPSIRIVATEQQIEKIGKECGTKKRPPYSYMHLIQMAISSKADKRMMLREIYQWIEDKFPYYRCALKQGWKNSIRHNLSLYNIFVREKPYTPGKSGSSYWTLREDLINKAAKNIRYTTLDTRPKCDPGAQMYQLGSSQPSVPELNVPTMLKPRKGPAPLLPKLPAIQTPLQTYALIPIPAGVPMVAPQPVVVSSWPVSSPATSQTCASMPSTTSVTSMSSASFNSTLKRAYPPETYGEPYRKHVRIAPKASILDKSAGRRVRTNSAAMTSLDTSDLQSQLSQVHMDSGIASDLSTSESSITLEQTSSRTQGLPRPVVYRNKRSRKDKVVVLRDCDEEISMSVHPSSTRDSAKENRPVRIVDLKSSPPVVGHDLHLSLNESAFSESGFNELIASMEKDFSSPMKGLLKTPPKPEEDAHTSTPSASSSTTLLSPSWISPIKNVAPLNPDGRGIDSGFFTPDGKLTSTPNGGNAKSRGARTSTRITGLKSPRVGSLRELGLPGLTPLKSCAKNPAAETDGHTQEESSPNTSLSNQSFQRLLGDLNLDSMMDDGMDLGNLSFLQC